MDDRVFKELKFGTPTPAPFDADWLVAVDEGLESDDLQTTVEGYMSKGVFHLTAVSVSPRQRIADLRRKIKNRKMNNTPRNNIRLEVEELETLVGIIDVHLDQREAVVFDDQQLTTIANRLRWLLFKEREKRTKNAKR